MSGTSCRIQLNFFMIIVTDLDVSEDEINE